MFCFAGEEDGEEDRSHSSSDEEEVAENDSKKKNSKKIGSSKTKSGVGDAATDQQLFITPAKKRKVTTSINPPLFLQS